MTKRKGVFHGQESEESSKEENQKSRKEILLLPLTHSQAAGLDSFNLAA